MRSKAIDFLKAMAIIGVLQNHLPVVARIYDATYSLFAVSLFVIMGGVTSALSLDGKNIFDKGYYWKRIKNILLPYAVAICAYVFLERGYFDIIYIFNKFIIFTGHMYYITFFLELIMAAPVLVAIYRRCQTNKLIQLLVLASSIWLSIFFQKYTYIEKFALGGKFLFGGSYFFLFNFGIYCYYNRNLLNTITSKWVAFISGVLGLTYIIYKQWNLIWWSNPPVKEVVIYAIVIFILCYSGFGLIQSFFEKRITRVKFKDVVLPMTFIGKNSLYVYLWHVLIIDILLRKGVFSVNQMGMAKKIAVNCFILYLPCFMYVIYVRLKKYLFNFLTEDLAIKE